jgi:LmbE family N-acetylglucosaminyl deacetylase
VPPKRNPLNLNPLQLKTLTLLQAVGRLPECSRPGEEPGSILLTALPHPHGDHFHLGDAVVAARDATGLGNPAVWTALARKGLVQAMASGEALLTRAGVDYETGLTDTILHKSAH